MTFLGHAHFSYAEKSCPSISSILELFTPYQSNSDISALIQDKRIQEAIWLLRGNGFASEAQEIEMKLAAFLEKEDLHIVKNLRGSSYPQMGNMADDQIEVIVKYNKPRREVAAYKIDRMIGLHAIPVTVLRSFKYKVVSLQYRVRSWPSVDPFLSRHRKLLIWIMRTLEGPAPATAYKYLNQNHRFFDWLIGNYDRPTFGNVIPIKLKSGLWKWVLVDHHLAFTYKTPDEILSRPKGIMLGMSGPGGESMYLAEKVLAYAQTVTKTPPSPKLLDAICAIPVVRFASELSHLLTEEELTKFMTRIQEIQSHPPSS